jgi:pimeloyl-ACP methyl ester carboxylesterase
VATVNKDFKVKNGLAVVLGGSFGGTVTVATPTDALHAATKAYVDAAAGSGAIPVGSTFPASPIEGQLFIDSVTKRIHMYLNASWIAVATLEDAESLQDHIHDTAIDGTGLIVSTFVAGGSYDEPGVLVSAGSYSDTTWENTWDGGTSIDNFN